MTVDPVPRRSRWRRGVAGGAAILLAAGGLAAVTSVPAHAQTACEVDFQVNEWGDDQAGFTGSVTISNVGDPIDGWTLEFALPGNASLGQGWNADWSQDGQDVTASNLSWNSGIDAGGEVSIGFNGTGYAGAPEEFTLNGVVCDGEPGEDPPPDVELTSPAAGQEFEVGTSVELAAEATSPAGIADVEFYVDGEAVGSDDTEPYTVTVDDLAIGAHEATAVAVDAGDPQQSTESEPVSFSVVEEADPAILASPSSLSLIEGNSGDVTFTLNEAPGSEVTVELTTSGGVTADTDAFVLDDDTFDSGAQVSVTGVAAGSGSVTASAPGYDDVEVSVTVTEGGDPGERVANPYEGADVYVNEVWGQQVLDQAAQTDDPELASAMEEVATYPTAVWMDRRGAITDGIGLEGHLDEALAQQQASGGEMVFQVVIYNLPNRDCAADASNGELLISENGFEIYREEYIDVITDILSRPEYASLRIVAVIEVDSLPNLVTNLDEEACQEADGEGGYRDGIRYALNEFADIDNVYSYLDIAHSGWLGWDDNFNDAVNLYMDMLTSEQYYGPAPGLDSINGFITNSANYTPTEEPFLPDSDLVPPGGGNPVRSADFYEWNPHFDELSFTQALHDSFSQEGLDDFGMLIDTSRNGWGGPDRPTEVSDAEDVNTYVDESRIDRRPHRGGWCNQDGAGIGERPQTSPEDGIHAYVWVKPPGESDGVSDPDFEPDPDDPNKQHDAMCDPEGENSYDPSQPTNALPNAPHAGRWFPEQFEMLVENAYPAF
ncbi:cellobiohydrolase [Actinobacteria bacterium YIM 96077]|uniref:Glucanase n=1 Tax=Phytoactinopolyspora halophila TaxID=1981511 RepID=A0A329R004_9ACTN|nr:glycoside hydrolase family 6 protein [Phytoactinopolyspora halophila]AYY11566.1 cellobiohydrolase [Actinobacteria bacterium YIM 96077]RAW17950.1 cellobiohydrolase [Phytoactinopolyspora halophila]